MMLCGTHDYRETQFVGERCMGLFTGKTLMITGGTGSFGNAVLNRFLTTDIGEMNIPNKLRNSTKNNYSS